MLCLNIITKKIRPLALGEQVCRSVSSKESWGHIVDKKEEVSRWRKLNEKVFEPTTNNEDKRPAYVCHEKRDVWYSYKKLYIVSCFVRGLSVDEAVKQLNFVNSKGAMIVKDTILEAQELAIKHHDVEFKSNLWVAESFPEKSYYLRGYRRHARANVQGIRLQHCHYFVRLEEGKPPKDYYYYRRSKTPQELLDEWVDELRKRKIISSL